MATKWTEQQAAAIEAKEKTLLISAAAGSGKTAVLIERIMRLLMNEGASIDRMLIVTFTRAAASEMQQRLYHRLCEEIQGEHPELAVQLDLLPQAQISTIHGFCQKVMRSDFQAAEIDPLARIADSNTGNLLFQQSMEEAMNALLEAGEDEGFGALMESFAQREIFEMCGELYHFMMAMPQPFAWLKEKVADIPAQGEIKAHEWYEKLLWVAGIQVQGLGDRLSIMEQMMGEAGAMEKAGETIEKDRAALEALMTTEPTAQEPFLNALKGVSFARLAPMKAQSEAEAGWKKEFQKRRDGLKKKVKELQQLLLLDEEKAGRELQVVKRLLQGLESYVSRTHEVFLEKKKKQTLLDFSDLEQMTLQVLSQEDICDKVRMEYDHIFVDECQDVSAIQYAILTKIHDDRNVLFMVGDVKQSIYRFRLADPTLFLHNMRTFDKKAGGAERTIALQTNFRSDKSILEATNMIFRKLMDGNVTELSYEAEDELIAPEGKENGAPVELVVLSSALTVEQEAEEDTDEDEGELLQGIAAEAAVAAEKMHQMHGGGAGEKRYAWRDMVILMPKVKNVAAQVAEQLQNSGIPVYCDDKGSYFDLPEITTLVALLKVMDDPMQDLPLMTTLKLPGFRVTDEEMADIRLMKSGRDVSFYEAFCAVQSEETELGAKCRRIAETLGEWRFRLSTRKISAFLWDIMEETGYYALVGAMPHGEARQANLRLLCQRVMEYEQVSDGSLMGFLEWQEEMRQSGDSTAATLLGDNEDLVRIMTIHKSKGLQFPVVFTLGMGLGKGKSGRSKLRRHRTLGTLLPYVNAKLRIRRDTFAVNAFDGVAKMEMNAERVRLLYVAMTRAQERLILIGTTKDVRSPLCVYPAGPHRIDAAGSMLDWVMQVLLDEPELYESWRSELNRYGVEAMAKKAVSTGHPQAAKLWNIKVCRNGSPQAVEKRKVINSLFQQAQTGVSEASVDGLWEKWRDIYAQQTGQPLKTSVTALVKQELALTQVQSGEAEETPEDKREPEVIAAPLRMDTLPQKPRFLQAQKLTGADRGTMMHKALSLTELDKLRKVGAEGMAEELRREIGEWTQRQLFTKEEAKELDAGRMAEFYQSRLGQRLLQSPEVHREWSFNFRLSHDRETILQGVMDCAFREPEGWVLVDYKTDRVEDEGCFVQRYEKQLRLYALALAETSGTPVTEMWLYALGLKRAIRVGAEDTQNADGVFL